MLGLEQSTHIVVEIVMSSLYPASAASIAVHVIRSSGRRSRLRRVHRTADASTTVAGSAFSNATALGTKSTSDHTRITA